MCTWTKVTSMNNTTSMRLSTLDPSNDLDIRFCKYKHKGWQYCLAAAIQGPDPLVDIAELASGKAGLVKGILRAFCPQKKHSHKGDSLQWRN